jgi:hypothetical protein
MFGLLFKTRIFRFQEYLDLKFLNVHLFGKSKLYVIKLEQSFLQQSSGGPLIDTGLLHLNAN